MGPRDTDRKEGPPYGPDDSSRICPNEGHVGVPGSGGGGPLRYEPGPLEGLHDNSTCSNLFVSTVRDTGRPRSLSRTDGGPPKIRGSIPQRGILFIGDDVCRGAGGCQYPS